jgi:hypothetical protein
MLTLGNVYTSNKGSRGKNDLAFFMIMVLGQSHDKKYSISTFENLA